MPKSIILTANAPAPIGPYSQAVSIGDLVFLSGQIPLDPATGNLVDEDIEAATERVLENIRAVLGAIGLGFHKWSRPRSSCAISLSSPG